MIIIIDRCFNWIGFNMITYFLEEGCTVIGIDPMDTEEKESLYMYVGRNSNFQHFSSLEVKEKHIHSGEEDVYITFDDDVLKINRFDNQNVSVFSMPTLYGEWMNGDAFHDYKEFSLWVKEHKAVDIQYLLSQIKHYISTGQWELLEENGQQFNEERMKEIYRTFRTRMIWS